MREAAKGDGRRVGMEKLNQVLSVRADSRSNCIGGQPKPVAQSTKPTVVGGTRGNHREALLFAVIMCTGTYLSHLATSTTPRSPPRLPLMLTLGRLSGVTCCNVVFQVGDGTYHLRVGPQLPAKGTQVGTSPVSPHRQNLETAEKNAPGIQAFNFCSGERLPHQHRRELHRHCTGTPNAYKS